MLTYTFRYVFCTDVSLIVDSICIVDFYYLYLKTSPGLVFCCLVCGFSEIMIFIRERSPRMV